MCLGRITISNFFLFYHLTTVLPTCGYIELVVKYQANQPFFATVRFNVAAVKDNFRAFPLIVRILPIDALPCQKR